MSFQFDHFIKLAVCQTEKLINDKVKAILQYTITRKFRMKIKRNIDGNCKN